VDVIPALVPHAEAAELMQPRERAFDHPAHDPQPDPADALPERGAGLGRQERAEDLVGRSLGADAQVLAQWG